MNATSSSSASARFFVQCRRCSRTAEAKDGTVTFDFTHRCRLLDRIHTQIAGRLVRWIEEDRYALLTTRLEWLLFSGPWERSL